MRLNTLTTLASVIAITAALDVPVPWSISNIALSNVRHGTEGFWSFDILDSVTPTPQGMNTTCSYSSSSYYFALDQPPYDVPCKDSNVTFGFFPDGASFVFNVTHVYNCGTGAYSQMCTDNGTWHFSIDDVRGQQDDVENNFGQAGGFTSAGIQMYPTRTVPSSKCEFC